MFFLTALIIISVLILFKNPFVKQFKLKVFRIRFERIIIQTNDNSVGNVYLSDKEGRLHYINTNNAN